MYKQSSLTKVPPTVADVRHKATGDRPVQHKATGDRPVYSPKGDARCREEDMEWNVRRYRHTMSDSEVELLMAGLQAGVQDDAQEPGSSFREPTREDTEFFELNKLFKIVAHWKFEGGCS